MKTSIGEAMSPATEGRKSNTVVAARGADVMATEWAVFVIGIMMVMSGIAEIIAAFSVKSWGRAVLWMLLGVLYVIAGIICFTNPFAAAFVLTLFLGMALVIGGVVR